MNKKLITIALLSLSILATELFWTRIFSAEFFYTFAFLILSLAILGLGLGALVLSIFTKLNRPSLLPWWLSLTAVFILAGVPLVFSLDLDFTKLVTERMQILKLAGAVLILGSGFFFGGISIAQIFKMDNDKISRLYMADFIGAAAGVILFIIIMNAFGAAVTLVFCAMPVLIAAFINSQKWIKVIPAAIFTASVVYIYAGDIPEQKREERAKIVYKHWDAVAKIKVYEFDSTYRGINIDNAANTPVMKFDGNWNIPDSLKGSFPIDVGYLMNKFDKCRFLSLGAGGGGDVFQALMYNASEVHAVEVNPHINFLLKEGGLKEFSGNIYNDPRVKVITEDARVYIRGFHNKFDVIYSLSSNTFAAFASGSFALAENYIFTTEAMVDYWNALSDKGYMMLEHQFYTPRLVAELMDALEMLDVKNPSQHFAVYNLPRMKRKILLISKSPLDTETLSNAFGKLSPEKEKDIYLLYPKSESKPDNLINRIALDGWKASSDSAKIDISPCTDNRPFAAQLGMMKNFIPAKLDKVPMYEFTGFPLSKLVMFIILGICIIIVVPFNLIPYMVNREKLQFRNWMYFFMIGMGYMMIEVILMQKYTLFIGSSIYSMALTLTTLLLFSGIGSRHSGKYSSKIIFGSICLWILLDITVFKELFYLFNDWPLIPRLILSGLLIAPLGYFMGMPFPKLGSKIPSVIDWAFAITGSASVIGSALVVLAAISFGYTAALIIGMLMYAAAYLFYSEKTADKEHTNSVTEIPEFVKE